MWWWGLGLSLAALEDEAQVARMRQSAADGVARLQQVGLLTPTLVLVLTLALVRVLTLRPAFALALALVLALALALVLALVLALT